MIDFRYHLVSIIAVFLSLAVGLVLGTTALNGPAVDALRGQVQGLSDDKRELRAEQDRLRQQLATDAELLSATTPALVARQLAGHQVALVQAGEVPDETVDELTGVLQGAGAGVASRVELTDEYLSAEGEEPLREALRQLGTQPAEDTDPTQQAAGVLASVLVAGDGGLSGPGSAPPPNPTTVFSAFEDAGMLQAEQVAGRATTAVILAPAEQSGDSGEYGTVAVVRLAVALDGESDGVVVAAPEESARAGLLASLRDDRAARRAVSSVDGVDVPAGRLQTVYALAEQLSGQAGAYGAVAGEIPPVPTVAGR